jgi:hypothetical protein
MILKTPVLLFAGSDPSLMTYPAIQGKADARSSRACCNLLTMAGIFAVAGHAKHHAIFVLSLAQPGRCSRMFKQSSGSIISVSTREMSSFGTDKEDGLVCVNYLAPRLERETKAQARPKLKCQRW